MRTLGKIINNKLEYSSEFMYLEKLGSWVSYPTENQIIEDGYKDILYEDVDIIDVPFLELETEIIIYNQKIIQSESENSDNNIIF